LILDLDTPFVSILPHAITSEGNYAIIKCSVDSSSKVVDFSWYKDDVLLTTTSSEIILNNVHLKDAGQYRCHVNNAIERKQSNNVSLTVHCK